jgi:hypothetical protein
MAKPVKPKKNIVFNPLEGQFDVITGNNFSYESVPGGKSLKIRENEQMVVYEEFSVDGDLDLDGTLIVES